MYPGFRFNSLRNAACTLGFVFALFAAAKSIYIPWVSSFTLFTNAVYLFLPWVFVFHPLFSFFPHAGADSARLRAAGRVDRGAFPAREARLLLQPENQHHAVASAGGQPAKIASLSQLK